jgi:hypothetical protein
MGTTRQTGQERRARRWRAMLGCGAFGLSVTIATGCSTTAPTTAQQSYDPLHGVRTPPGTLVPPTNPPSATASAAQPPAVATSPGGVPALPASLSATNTSALAGANSQSPLGQPFPINDPNARPPLLAGQTTTTANSQPAPGVPAPNPNPKVEPVPDAVPSAPPAVTPIANWQSPQSNQPAVQTAGAIPTPDYAKQLRDRGVFNQKIDQVPDGVQLTCYVSRGPTGGVRILTVTAKDDASAAQAMLRELDQQR